jgi:putative pyruvate formate lyase activating enzyme
VVPSTKKLAPSYLSLGSKEVRHRAEALIARLSACDICPHECGADRTGGEVGICGTPSTVRVASFNLHHGEEPCISGHMGSGTIFFSGCSLKCVFCQNYPISQLNHGQETSVVELAAMMVVLKRQGAHNINLVTPTHVAPQWLLALSIAMNEGLDIPIVYNSGGYDRVDVIEALRGIVDVYMPDMKYSDEALARRLSAAPNYPDVNRAAVAKMYESVGDWAADTTGVAMRGVLVRHLIIPGQVENSIGVLDTLAEISKRIRLSLMTQYFPAHKAVGMPELDRTVTCDEFRVIDAHRENLGLEEGWIQRI